MKEIRVDSLSANQRLDKFLMKYFKAASSGFIYKMLRKKNIVLNGKKDTGKTILLEGDSIKVFFSDETFDKMRGLETSKSEYEHLKDINYSLDVIYEDDDIIACNKPATMLSQKSNPDDISINEYILSYLINEKGYSLEEYRVFHPSVSNRLDYNTTGIILGAKTLQGQQKLSLALKNRTIDKFYIALVEGKLDRGITLNGTFTKDEDNNKYIFTSKELYENFIRFLQYEPLVDYTPSKTALEKTSVNNKFKFLRYNVSVPDRGVWLNADSIVSVEVLNDPLHADKISVRFTTNTESKSTTKNDLSLFLIKRSLHFQKYNTV